MSNFSITKREFLSSIIIIMAMIMFGILVSEKINDKLIDDYQKYKTALKIQNDTELFEYGMRTNVGDAIIYGELKAVDTVSYPDVSGEYMYIRKTEEHYNKHIETYTTKVNGKSVKRTKVHWSWDYVGEKDKHSKKLSFLGVEFKYDKINIPDTKYIDTVKKGRYVRYVYEGVGIKHKGTLLTELDNKTISDNSDFYVNKTIDETIKYLEPGNKMKLFWFVWIIITGVVVFMFYYFDNRWLEDKN